MKLLYSLALIVASAILSEGSHVKGDTTTLENVELYETFTKFPVVEDRALRGRNLNDYMPRGDLLDIHYYGSVPQIVKDALANVSKELNSLIESRLDYELEEELVVKDVCQIPVSEDVVIKPQTMRSIPLFVGPFDADEVDLNTKASGFPCHSYKRYFANHEEYNRNRTLLGRIQFNPALINDTTNEQYVHDLLLHEAIHVLGFGVFWEKKVYLGAMNTLRYSGSANWGYRHLLKEGDYRRAHHQIPIDDDKKHWKGSAFPTEIMSSIIEEGEKQILSQLTALAIGDLGYKIDWNSPVIQPYKIPYFKDKEAKNHNKNRGFNGKLRNTWSDFKFFWNRRVLGHKYYLRYDNKYVKL